MSSLGDVVHALAGVTDAVRAKPGIIFDWVVEEAYQEIPKWHPGVRRVIVSPLRRWRKSPVRTIRTGEWKAFRESIRAEQYDLVLDAQGLLKSAFVGLQSGGLLVGRSAGSAREPATALLYKRRCKVNLDLTEVEQLRELFALALGYERPQSATDFGIEKSQFIQKPPETPYTVFLHGAAWESKLWPETHWEALGRFVRRKGLRVLLPWGSDSERQRAERIAEKVDGELLGCLGLGELARILAGASFVVGLDTGLTHIAIALGGRTVTLYGPSVPVYDRVAKGELVNLASTVSTKVDTTRPTTVAVNDVLRAIGPWMEPNAPLHR